jgi:16S rRNA (cytosine1402-N4)-methyltransferase
MDTLPFLLKKNGILCAISFHSLEDRIMKHKTKFLEKENGFLMLTKKPLVPDEDEIFKNPASRSAKLRVIQKNE